MSNYKLVPVEPTPEMVEAAESAHMPFGDMDLAIRMAILEAPVVEQEPVSVADALRQIAGWMDDGGPTYHEAEMIGMEIAGPTGCNSHQRCVKAAENAFLEAARIWECLHPAQPTAQQPAPAVEQEVTVEGYLHEPDTALPYLTLKVDKYAEAPVPLVRLSAYKALQAECEKLKAEVPEVAQLVEALECALETMENVDGANDCSRGIDAAEEALAAYRNGGES